MRHCPTATTPAKKQKKTKSALFLELSRQRICKDNETTPPADINKNKKT